MLEWQWLASCCCQLRLYCVAWLGVVVLKICLLTRLCNEMNKESYYGHTVIQCGGVRETVWQPAATGLIRDSAFKSVCSIAGNFLRSWIGSSVLSYSFFLSIVLSSLNSIKTGATSRKVATVSLKTVGSVHCLFSINFCADRVDVETPHYSPVE